jgi:hypothetical protein
MKRENLVGGLILILLGLAFLAYQLFPEFFGGFSWPWILAGIGAVLAVGSLVGGIGGMMIPAAILLGLSGIFLYQERTGDWGSWAYVWALIPGFVGLGMFIGGLYDRELGQARGASVFLILLSAGLFVVFGGFFGLDLAILRFWPVLLILFGIWVLIKALRRPEKISGE